MKQNNKSIPSNIEEVSLPQMLEEDLLFKVCRELASIEEPRSQIFIAHGFIELLINTVIKECAKNGKKITNDNRSFPYSTQLVILHEMGLLTDNEFKLYNWFRKLRNKAAHQPLFELTKEDLKNISPKEQTFTSICFDLMTRLWNRHTDILLPVFVPTLHKSKS